MHKDTSERVSGLRLSQAFFSFFNGQRKVLLTIHLWLAVVLIVCVVPTDSVSAPAIPYLDKWVHAAMYAIPAFILALVGRLNRFWLVYLAGFGATVEVIQAQLGYRSGDIYDFLADIFGIILGWIVGSVIWHIRKKY